MFTLDPKPTFWAAIPISIPGEAQPGEIRFLFRHMPADAVNAWIQASVSRTDFETCAEIIADWDGVDAEFSPEALRKLVDNFPAAAPDIFRGYLAALRESRAKNSGPPPSDGLAAAPAA